jgi:glucose dehydrogenase
MRWDIPAVFAVVLGFLLIIKGLDTLTIWRAWFFGISGLVLLLAGMIRIAARIRNFRTRNSSIEDKD